MDVRLNRRMFLQAAAAATLSGAETKRLKVLVTGGHPGDPEYGCGGTIARFSQRGDQVTMLYLNRGQRGCPAKSLQDCGALRTGEGNTAARILGASTKFADQVDGDASVSSASYDKFFELVQQEAPDVVFTHWPVDNHRDHRAISNLTYDAWLRSHKSFALYFYEVSDGEDTMMFSPSDYVDISGTEDKKHAACFAHASQSPERFYSLQNEVARFRGVESGYRLAEAFIRHTQSPGHLLP